MHPQSAAVSPRQHLLPTSHPHPASKFPLTSDSSYSYFRVNNKFSLKFF